MRPFALAALVLAASTTGVAQPPGGEPDRVPRSRLVRIEVAGGMQTSDVTTAFDRRAARTIARCLTDGVPATTVGVSLSVGANGRITDVTVHRSSGNETVDRCVMGGIRPPSSSAPRSRTRRRRPAS